MDGWMDGWIFDPHVCGGHPPCHMDQWVVIDEGVTASERVVIE